MIGSGSLRVAQWQNFGVVGFIFVLPQEYILHIIWWKCLKCVLVINLKDVLKYKYVVKYEH